MQIIFISMKIKVWEVFTFLNLDFPLSSIYILGFLTMLPTNVIICIILNTLLFQVSRDLLNLNEIWVQP